MRAIVLCLVLVVAGCGSALDRARQTVGAAATLGKTAGELVIVVNETRQDEIGAELERDHDAAKAARARDDWRATRARVRQALLTYNATVVAAGATVELADGRVDIGKLVVQLSGAYVALRDALSSYGVQLPGGAQ